MQFAELLHIIGTMLAFLSGMPAIYKNFEGRDLQSNKNPLNQLSTASLLLLLFAGAGRLPNVFKGLINAIKSGNKENIRRFALISFGSFFVTFGFWMTAILASIYREETTEKQKTEKRIIQMGTGIFSCMILASVAYLINGIFKK